MRNLIEYIRWSTISIAVQLNPFHWLKCHWFYEGPTDMNPGAYCISVRFVMLRINVNIDDGSW